MKKNFELNKVVICVNALIAIVIIMLLLDYSDKLYVISKHFNYDFLGIFIPNIVLIFIFFMTYYLIDKRNIEKEEQKKRNQLTALNIVLQKTYQSCKKVLDRFINDSYTLKEFIIPSNTRRKDGGNICNDFKKLPFENNEQIMKMLYEGLVGKDIISKYLRIKELYSSYIDEKINMYDLLQYKEEPIEELKKTIEKDNKELKSLLKDEINRIETDLSLKK